MAWVSMKSTWHAAATDLHPVKGSEKNGLGQHGVHMACSSHRLTFCQGVTERWLGSAWSPHGMQQPQTYSLSMCQRKMASAWSPHGMRQPQTYNLSKCQRKMAMVSMKFTWQAAATDLLSVKVSEKDGLGQHGVQMACSSHRLTCCQGVKKRWPGSAWSPHGMQ